MFHGIQPDGIESKAAIGGVGSTLTVCDTDSVQMSLLTVSLTSKSPGAA